MWSCCRPKGYLISWISLSKTLVFFITISHSIIHGQIPETDFVPVFGPHGPPHGGGGQSFISGNEIGHSPSGGFGSGDLQSSFLELFDWSKEMPQTDIVNTFLDNEEELPILKELSNSCPRSDFFYGTNPNHMQAVMKIKNLLMEQSNAQDAITMAATLRDKREINPNAWLRGVIAASMFRPDLQGLRKPALVEVMPGMFVNSVSLNEMKRQSQFGTGTRTCVPVDGSVGRDNGVENVLWYWREDVMLNSHHWYWHLTYPIEANNEPRQDRRGELFAFMHHTFLARYHAERLANGLLPLLPLNLQRGTIIREAYNPHLNDANSGRNWTPRPPNVPISDTMSSAIPMAPFFVSVDNRTVHISRILESISFRTALSAFNGETNIGNSRGIDILGDIVEASEFSINPEYYGYHGIHNTGHVLLSLILDPRQRQGLPPGVMGDPATAMRDIVFYPYHTFIDDIFDAHKRTLPPYQLKGGDWPLVWPGVDILNVKVQSGGNFPTNNFNTFWGERRYDLSRGLDFNRTAFQGPIWTCVRHLDHQDFEYQITIDKKPFVRSNQATIRIFLAPRYNEKGQRYPLEEQRRRFFILDKFTVTLNAGMNRIKRSSTDSTLTIDFPQSYQELQQDRNLRTTSCGCGWPHHLLLPKGTPEGMAFDLFVMVTNGKRDIVPQSGRPQVCRAAPIFCGILGERYPDARPMGYPFDRSIYKATNINPLDPAFDEIAGPIALEEWISEIPNMAAIKVTVTHTDEVRGGAVIFDEGLGADYDGPSGINSLQNFGPVGPSAVAIDNVGSPPGFKDILPPGNSEFFNDFFPAGNPTINHPKRFVSSIDPPAKEFMQLIYGKQSFLK